ncbi:BTB/POZ and TAZ domain-containing protein 2 isoform X2 [Musa acuminata AAA Group]|uniref:BTB domain-containing protein n=1 Tax=Musa acuminata subsp. malaccensis TaxID=214687 RepID=A0A804HMS3_MUSAM|nr:PREDICTED: BTB/POZ and TAZ domain-containing protein 2 isoform X2 [Musa acuminata subsp. malaccensis]
MTASVTHRNGLIRRWHEAGNECVPPTDVQIVTSDGKSIPAHSSVLASASPVLERMLDRSRKGGNSERIIHVLGVPHDAVLVFLQFLYSSGTGMWSREAEEEMERHGMALLALSHAYRVRWLKRRCEAGVAAWLSAVKVMDVLKLARLCDAPRLYQRCMRLVAKDLEAVQQSEGWRFVQKHDPGLETEVLQLLQETSQWKTPSCNSEWRSHCNQGDAVMSFQSSLMTIDHSFRLRSMACAAREAMAERKGRSRQVQATERSHGLPAAHMHRRLHRRRAAQQPSPGLPMHQF